MKRTLGFEKNPPDEFAVVSRDPLTLPPDFSLVPPTVRDTKKDSQRAQEAAKKALKQGGAYGSSAPVSAEDARRLKGNLQDGSQGPTAESKTFQTNRPSSLDAVLKKSRASVGDIAPEDLSMIRSQVDEEAGVYVEPEEKGIIERALFWQKKTKPTEKLVDPMLEKQRLSEAQKSQPEEATSVIVVTEESSVGG